MSKVFLISEQTLKDATILGANVEGKYIRQAIQTAQDLRLQTVIGTNLYHKLCELVEDESVSGAYKILLDDYISPFLQNAVLADLTLKIAYKFRNEGVVTTTSENVAQPVLSDVQAIKAQYETAAGGYATLMTKWLVANSTSIPEYCVQRDCADIQANPGAYQHSLFIPKK